MVVQAKSITHTTPKLYYYVRFPLTRPDRLLGVTSNNFLFHDLLLRCYLYDCVWSVITAHNLTPTLKHAL